MDKILLLTGNYAAAYAAKAARVEVIAAYPITPQTPVVEKLSEFCERGELKAEFIHAESEHSAMTAIIAAASAGARTFTATSSQGLALMHEMLHYAAGGRLPICLYVANRALALPWSIWCDHQDSISQRDTGWMQFYVESCQELFDTILMAYRIAEDKDILLPIMVCADGFILSHRLMPVEIPDQSEVDNFLPPYVPEIKLSPENPILYGSGVPPAWYAEYKFLQQQAMLRAEEKIREVCKEFEERFGRFHGTLIEEYRCEDADVVLVSMGSLALQAKMVVDEMRSEGYRVGAVKLRVLRPFPAEDFRRLAKQVKAFAVVDRNISFGSAGVAFTEIKAALYEVDERPLVKGYIMGLGGRDVRPEHQCLILLKTLKELERGSIGVECEWIGFKEPG